MDPSKAHYTLSHGQIAHLVKSEPDINVTVATSRVPTEMTVQGQRCVEDLNYRQSPVADIYIYIYFFFNNLYFNNKVHYINTSQYCYIHYTGRYNYRRGRVGGGHTTTLVANTRRGSAKF